MTPTRRLRLETGPLHLHAEVEGEGPPLLLLHGFTGSGRSLEDVAAGLRDRWRCARLDLVGHGRSDAPRDASLYTMESCVEQVAAALDALGLPDAHVLGYSMGGRVALALCAWRPERVRSALLVGARAGFRDPAARAERRRADEALAARLERDGLERFVDHWMSLPLFASQRRRGEAALARDRAARLRNRPHGLAASLRGMGAGAQPPLHACLGGVERPVALVAGAEDAAFLAEARDLARRLPDARVLPVPRAGHACHLEQPEAFLEIARGWLADAEARRAAEAERGEPRAAKRSARPPAAGPDATSARPTGVRAAANPFVPSHRRNA